MTATAAILALVGDPILRDDVDRVAAASGLQVVHAADPSSRKVWTGAVAVLLDVQAARRCADRALPRRGRVVLVGRTEPHAADWEAAIAVGAQHVITLPAQDGDADGRTLRCRRGRTRRWSTRRGHRGDRRSRRRGRLGVRDRIGANARPDALLIDADPWSGGIDLVLGTESDGGLRWPDLALQGGRLNFAALRDALPRRHGISVLVGRSRRW